MAFSRDLVGKFNLSYTHSARAVTDTHTHTHTETDYSNAQSVKGALAQKLYYSH